MSKYHKSMSNQDLISVRSKCNPMSTSLFKQHGFSRMALVSIDAAIQGILRGKRKSTEK